jgi:protocatechuate 3,4-dioxygenase beta subunit
MRWHCIFLQTALLLVLVLLVAHPAAARGNITPGIYPGTVKDVCAGDTIFVGEKGLNLTPLTPYASGVVEKLRMFENDDPEGKEIATINVKESTNFDVPTVSSYGIYYPVVNKNVLAAYPVHVQPMIAGYPQNVVITRTKEWVIANGVDSALYTITVTDGAGNPVVGADLAVSAGAPWAASPWQVRDSLLKTGDGGKAQTDFLPTTRSGTAIVSATASVSGLTTAPVTSTLLQKIDADTPYSMEALYPGSATVGSPVTLSVRITDRHGNPVTSRRVENQVNFSTTTGGTGAFLDEVGNRSKSISVLLNETGWAGVSFLLGIVKGDNFVSITPPPPLSPSMIDIEGIGDSKPFSITKVVIPAGNPSVVPADGHAQATIDYYLYDQWGNPSVNQGLKISTSVGENRIFYTNQEGRASVLYGPKLSAGYYQITATAEENTSVSVQQIVQFVSMDPDDMLLTAIPQTMASLDVNKNMTASVIAKVIDERGNPVEGETVTFSIEKSDNGTFVQTGSPVIEGGGVTTSEIGVPVEVKSDGDGQAILVYRPGKFPDPFQPGYNANAQGRTTINATWEGTKGIVERNITLNYKNYPFISVYTEVAPRTVMVDGLVNVSVILKGDGWALQPKPIDVVLLTDRSATMLYNESIGADLMVSSESPDDRMVDAMHAATTFVDKTSDQDRTGLITFGTPKGGIALLKDTGNSTIDANLEPERYRAGQDFACKPGKKCGGAVNFTDDGPYIAAHYTGHGSTGRDYRVNMVQTGFYVESNLTNYKDQVKAAINSIVPAGGTPMRKGLCEAVKLLRNNTRERAVQAIVLLTDGRWDTGGDPRSIDPAWGGPSFCDGAPKDPVYGDGRGSLIKWAKDSNIKIFTIALGTEPYKDQLLDYATQTGGEYHEAKNSTELESIYLEIAGELREEASVDTKVNLDFKDMEVNTTYHLAGNEVFEYLYLPGGSTFVKPPEEPGYTVNSSDEWDKGLPFSFSAGTIKVDQTWLVNFTLRSRIEGNIRLLSGSSKVTFVGAEGEVGIPDTYVTAVPFGKEKGPEVITCEVQLAKPELDPQIAHLSWDLLSYNGNQGKISWEVWLIQPFKSCKDSFDWGAGDTHVTYPMYIGNLDPGTYMVEVVGKAGDLGAPCRSQTLITITGPDVTPQILIQ